MSTKVPDVVKFTLECLLAVAYRQKLKSIIVCTLNESGMSSIQRNALTFEKAIFPPLLGAENIIDTWNCDTSPTECRVSFILSYIYIFFWHLS